jgi:tripartite-type tricarboxylate transporter receptor subunit TctC
VHKRLIDAGDDAFDMTPEQMAAFLREERVRWSNLIKAVGITAK